MAKKKEIIVKEKMSIFNKGKRTWPITDIDGKEYECRPGKAVEISVQKAEKLLEGYPSDFIKGASISGTPVGKDVKKLKKRIAELEKENAALKESGDPEASAKFEEIKKAKEDADKRISEMTEEIAKFEEEVRDLKLKVEELEKINAAPENNGGAE